MKALRIQPTLLMLAIGLLLAGCIPVKNVEKAWKDAKPDEALAGLWAEKSGDGMVGFAKTDQGYLVTSGTSGLEGGCKSIETNGHKYIIVAQLRAAVLGFDNVDDDTKDGTLLRYKIDGENLTLYTYNQQKIDAAVKAGKVPGIFEEGDDNATLKELDAATIKWLGTIADEEEGWDVQAYKRK